MSVPWKRALIVGASSGIGEQLARHLAASGCRVALVARRAPELERIAADLNREHSGAALIYAHDVREYTCVPTLFQDICRDLGGLDLIVYAAGVMPAVAPDEYSFDKDQSIFEVNVLGAIAWLNEAARRFEVAGAGVLVGIGSVAGDRGRRGQPAYCASKAALATYLESLRNRLARRGVTVVAIKPGPVSTPMTHGLGKLPMIITADQAASGILDAASRGARVAYVPGKWRPVMWVIRHIPAAIFQKLNI